LKIKSFCLFLVVIICICVSVNALVQQGQGSQKDFTQDTPVKGMSSADVATNYNAMSPAQRGQLKAGQMRDLKHSQLDFNNMNKAELQKHLKSNYPNSNIKPANGMSMTDDGKLIYNGNDINIATLPQGSSIDVQNGGLYINGNQYTNAKNIKGNPDGSISTDSADLIRSDNVNFINISNSKIKTDDSYAVIITNESLKITDNTAGTVVYVDPIDTGIIAISKTSENYTYYTDDEFGIIKVDEQYTRYNITNATLIYKDERAVANGTSISLVVNKDKGFGCMDLSVGGYYYKEFAEDFRKDFMIYISRGDMFNLCFRKTLFDNFVQSGNYGLVDYVFNIIKINGMANYRRYPFIDDGVVEGYTKNVLDCINCSATMQLDKDFLYVEELSVNAKGNDSQVAIVNPSEYITIYEFSNASYFNLTDHNRANNIVLRYNNLFSGFSAVIENNIYKDENLEIYPSDENIMQDFIDEYKKEIEELS